MKRVRISHDKLSLLDQKTDASAALTLREHGAMSIVSLHLGSVTLSRTVSG